MQNAHGSKAYLGDGVYVCYDGHGLILTVEDGTDIPREVVYVNPEVWHRLRNYVIALTMLAEYNGTEN